MNTTVTFSVAQQASLANVKPVAATLAKADMAYDAAIPAAAKAVALALGEKPSLEFWEAVSAAFKAAYKEERKCADGTAQNRWEAVAKYMASEWDFQKPKAVTAEAKKKQAQRAKEEKAVKAAKAKFVKPADAFEAAAKLASEGKEAEARIVTKAAHELSADNIKNAGKQASDKLKKFRDMIREELAKCADVEALQAALEVLKYGKATVDAADAKKASKAKEPVKA